MRFLGSFLKGFWSSNWDDFGTIFQRFRTEIKVKKSPQFGDQNPFKIGFLGSKNFKNAITRRRSFKSTWKYVSWKLDFFDIFDFFPKNFRKFSKKFQNFKILKIKNLKISKSQNLKIFWRGSGGRIGMILVPFCSVFSALQNAYFSSQFDPWTGLKTLAKRNG